MPRHKVQSHAKTAASAKDVWSAVRDFCAPWHPSIASMSAERAEGGGLIRRFQVKDDDTTYRERLTYFSDSDRAMAYTHVEGIKGVQNYDARLTVTPSNDGAVVMMTADFSAPAPRAQEIADGTQMVFDTGTAALAKLDPCFRVEPPAKDQENQHSSEDHRIDNVPTLGFTIGGKDSDILCLFLHGIGGNRSNWDSQMQALAPHCRVASLDLRGYGDSTLGAAQSTIDDYCDDVLHILDHAGAKKLILCGLSYGAWIATSFAMRHGDKLAALVLSGGCTGMSEAGADERDAFRLSRETPMNAGQTPADFAPSVVNIIAGPQASSDVRNLLHASMAAIPATTYADALRCFTNPLEKFDFAKLTMPVLLMTGAHDRLAPPAEIKSVAERIWDASPRPDVRFEVIADAGHVCNVEKPEVYNAILTEFIGRILP